MTLAKSKTRRAAILVAVLVTMLVVTSIVGTAMMLSIRSQREGRSERQIMQVQFLCEAGALRATEKLLMDPTFAGDRWRPEIETKVIRDSTQSLIIEVIASLEAGPFLHRVQRTKQFPFQVPTN